MFIIVFFVAPKILYTYNSEIAFAKYCRDSEIRSTVYIVYEYEVNGSKYQDSFQEGSVKPEKLKRFKNGEKIKIKYIKILPFFSVIDESERGDVSTWW